MENAGYFIVFMVVGLFFIITSAANWEFMYKFTKTKTDVKVFGRYIARIAYFILGFLIFGFGFLSITGLLTL